MVSSLLLSVGVPTAAVVLSYSLLSAFLLRRPLFFKKPPSHSAWQTAASAADGQRTLLVSAHRGGAAERRENTLGAFLFSIQQFRALLPESTAPCDNTIAAAPNRRSSVTASAAAASSVASAAFQLLLELDVHMTLDGHVVVFHDHSTERTHDGPPAPIRSLTLAELRERKFKRYGELSPPPQFHPAGSLLEFDADSKRPTSDSTETKSYSALHDDVPLLSEVLHAVGAERDVLVNIDCKENSADLREAVSAIVHEQRCENKVIWGSASHANAVALSRLDPRIPRFFSARSTVMVYAAYMFGFLPFMRFEESYFEVPLFTQERLANFSAYGGRTKPNAGMRFVMWLLRYMSTQKLLYDHLRQRGVRTVFWVLNGENEFRFAFNDMKADGVMTDFPTRLFQFVKDGNLTNANEQMRSASGTSMAPTAASVGIAGKSQ